MELESIRHEVSVLGQAGRRKRRRVVKERTSVYHVICRTVRRSFWLEAAEKEMLQRMLFKQADFAGLEVLSFCLMSNHFHLLLRVPESPLRGAGGHGVSDAEILRRYETFYGLETPRSSLSVPELRAAFAAGGEVAEQARRMVLARMGDLSAFMRELKQRFGIWFNARHGNSGTIWSDRFKSILVENRIDVMCRVAAYIDLNPVRAGIVADPRDYRWSSYGSAMRGVPEARCGLVSLLGGSSGRFQEPFAAYRMLLDGRGKSGTDATASPRLISGVAGPTGSSSAAEALRCRIKDFSASIVLGDAAFVRDCQRRCCPGKSVKPACWAGWERLRSILCCV